MKLFTVGKIPMYCESITHRLERRKDHDVKVVDLTLKIEPFNAQLAAAMDQDEYGFVKRVLFKLADGEPNVDLRVVEFRPPGERQNLICYATPDSPEASIGLVHAKVTKIRARGSKDAQGWTFYVRVSIGPLSKTELEYVNAWYTEQRFVVWEAAEPSLEFEDDDGDTTTNGKEQLDGGGPLPIEPSPGQLAAAEHNRARETARRLPRRHPNSRPH